MDWATERLAINRQVRRILVSHFIDLGRLAFTVYPGKIMFRGSLKRVEGTPGELTPDLVRCVFEQVVLSNSRTQKVTTQFDNWRQEGAKCWVPTHGGTEHGHMLKAANLLAHPAKFHQDHVDVHEVSVTDTLGANTSCAPYNSP